MIPLLAGMILQVAGLSPQAWKERNHPDMPVLPPCELGSGTAVVSKIAQLPKDVAAELGRFFAPVGGLAETDGPFNSTDVVDEKVPLRRFVRAYHIRDYWIIWYERGGFVDSMQTIALRPQTDNESRGLVLRAQPGTTFFGDLCVASKAIIDGVTSTAP